MQKNLQKVVRAVACLLCPLVLVGCINPLPGDVAAAVSEPEALALLSASAVAHGGDEQFARVDAVRVRYDGEWLNGIWKLQPMLVDRGYRKASDETMTYRRPTPGRERLAWPVVTQTHTGPEGEKTVRWPVADPAGQTLAGGAAVMYDGRPVQDPARRVRVEEAAAMVAEAYRMFLTAPFYFTQHPGQVTAVMSEPVTVRGRECDQVLIELRPGLGVSSEDRVQAAIDRETRLVRRLRFSLDGFRKTAGATADVILDGHVTVPDGLTFPTRFLEVVVHPIHRKVHRWEAVDISVQTRAN
ncbi:MAG: hypothetical protein AAGG38_14260 [Planctomycetota bacterium]